MMTWIQNVTRLGYFTSSILVFFILLLFSLSQQCVFMFRKTVSCCSLKFSAYMYVPLFPQARWSRTVSYVYKLNSLPFTAQANIHIAIRVLQRPGMCIVITRTRLITQLEDRWNRIVTIKGFFNANLATYSRQKDGNAQDSHKTIHCDNSFLSSAARS